MADGYEMVACVKICVEELTSQLGSTDDAHDIFKAIPESLLERKLFSGLVEKAASVLANELGVVEDLFISCAPGAL